MTKAFTLLALLCACIAPVQAQKKAAPERCLPGAVADWKHADLANKDGYAKLADGFEARRNCNSVVVNIPGAFIDTLRGSRANPLSLQLSAAVFIRACSNDVRDVDAAINDDTFVKVAPARNGSSDPTEYLFTAKSGRVAKILVYLDEYDGVVGVVRMQDSRESPTARKSGQ